MFIFQEYINCTGDPFLTLAMAFVVSHRLPHYRYRHHFEYRRVLYCYRHEYCYSRHNYYRPLLSFSSVTFVVLLNIVAVVLVGAIRYHRHYRLSSSYFCCHPCLSLS